MAAPPSLNLLGEIGLLSGLVSWSWYLMFVLVFLSFFGAAYTLYIYSYSQHGALFSGLYSCSLGYVGELFVCFNFRSSLLNLLYYSDIIRYSQIISFRLVTILHFLDIIPSA
jgi:hypothetical protein